MAKDYKCEHGRQKHLCKECKVLGTGGASICEHNRTRNMCKDCNGATYCEHNRIRPCCKECKILGIGGASICEHDRIRSRCRECLDKGTGGGYFCEHLCIRGNCKKCGGSNICAHGSQYNSCIFCRPEQVYKAYKLRCARLERVFELTLDQFLEIIHLPCTYCEDSFEKLEAMYEGPKPGIDRKDSSKGYTLENSVSCCLTCNLSKLDRSAKDFVEHCTKIATCSAKKGNK